MIYVVRQSVGHAKKYKNIYFKKGFRDFIHLIFTSSLSLFMTTKHLLFYSLFFYLSICNLLFVLNQLWILSSLLEYILATKEPYTYILAARIQLICIKRGRKGQKNSLKPTQDQCEASPKSRTHLLIKLHTKKKLYYFIKLDSTLIIKQ